MQPKNSEGTPRWLNQETYTLLIGTWVLNEITVALTPAEICHRGYLAYSGFYLVGVIFVGLPLMYSEMSLAQYSNRSPVDIWEFFPLFQGVGYGTLLLVYLKCIHAIVLTSWYFEYTFFSVASPVPWASCAGEDNCMVKKNNVSLFQYCIELQENSNEECGLQLSSSCYFNRVIGNKTTKNGPNCMHRWQNVTSLFIISFLLFIFSLGNDKYLRVVAKIGKTYLALVMLILFCVTMSTEGSWQINKTSVGFTTYSWTSAVTAFGKGFLCTGTGSGILIQLSRESSFRSPINMLSISAIMMSCFVTLMYSFIAFSALRTMSYFHGGQKYLIETPNSLYFFAFSSISETLTYLDTYTIWTFLWFSSIFICLFLHEWLLFVYWREVLYSHFSVTREYRKTTSIIFIVFLCIISSIFSCSDMTTALNDASETIQIISSFCMSISLYWFYGFRSHNVDIIFMLGVKASYVWQVCWILNPIFLALICYDSASGAACAIYDDSARVFDVPLDVVLYYFLIAVYSVILVCVTVKQIIVFSQYKDLTGLFRPVEHWGPSDDILLKSRKMFLPEIMTREFLYRQVKIHGYHKSSEGATNNK